MLNFILYTDMYTYTLPLDGSIMDIALLQDPSALIEASCINYISQERPHPRSLLFTC